MQSEIRNRHFLFFLLRVALVAALAFGAVVLVNWSVDASHVISARSQEKMAELVLAGNTVAVPENYNERVYQTAVIERMDEMPETVILGSSRGTYLGKEITGYDSLFNHCVSGACLEDYYAVLSLFREKFGGYPSRVILEISPWILSDVNRESRWIEIYGWRSAAERLWSALNGQKPEARFEIQDADPFAADGRPFYTKESPWFSIPYFQYNCYVLSRDGLAVFGESSVHVSEDPSEAAEYPDGSIRNPASQENRSPERLAQVRSASGAVTFEYAHRMDKIGSVTSGALKCLVRDLLDRGSEVIFFLAPFSPTQCAYSFDENLNPGFALAETWLRGLAGENGIRLIGGYDARNFGLTDDQYIDYSHPDREAVKIIWEGGSQ